MPPIFQRRDAALALSRALPSAASSTVNSKPIDLQNSPTGNFLAECQIEAVAPALNTTMAPDTRTMTYSLIHGNALDGNGDISDAAVLAAGVIVQTGAGGAGAAAAKYVGRLPANVKRYVALRIVSGASTTDSSAVSASLALMF